MSTYAIGDIQGCYDPLRRLLERIQFDPAHDTLWCVGDLVNRGPQSLEVLRFIQGMGASAITVLGNHDLHLLALAEGFGCALKGDTLDAILQAPDRDVLLHWLRHQRMAWRTPNFLLVHAGVMPGWSADETMRLATEAEAMLQGEHYRAFFAQMYGNEPHVWQDSLEGMERLRMIVNTLTRLRYCTPQGEMDFHHKGAPGTQPEPLLPWFDIPGRKTAEATVIFGHWSTLGLVARRDLIALDTGCLWGGRLSAIRLEDREVFAHACPQQQRPGA